MATPLRPSLAPSDGGVTAAPRDGGPETSILTPEERSAEGTTIAQPDVRS
jgi:hypothetical protein